MHATTRAGARPLTRRQFCATLSLTCAWPAAACGSSGPPIEADQFVDSIGLCVHLASPPYDTRFEPFAALAGALGVRHFRDELRPDNDLSRWRTLHARFGIRSHWLVSPATNTVAEMLDTLAALGPEKVSAVEGQNEGDSDWFIAQPAAGRDWAEAVNLYQRDAFVALRARYSADALPMLSPALLDYKPADTARIAPSAPFCDMVAIHPYAQGGQEPETDAPYAGLPWYLHAFRDGFKPGAPVMATEAGYHNARGGGGLADAVTATYLPRLLLHAFSLGLVRTFLYEFMDEGTDAADPEQNYGLLRSDAAPKPAYHALKQLIGALSDPGPRFVPLPLALEVQDAPPRLRTVSFQKRCGAVYLALWLAERFGRVSTPVRVQIALSRPFGAAAALELGSSRGWTALPRPGGSLALAVSDTVTLVKLTA